MPRDGTIRVHNSSLYTGVGEQRPYRLLTPQGSPLLSSLLLVLGESTRVVGKKGIPCCLWALPWVDLVCCVWGGGVHFV